MVICLVGLLNRPENGGAAANTGLNAQAIYRHLPAGNAATIRAKYGAIRRQLVSRNMLFDPGGKQYFCALP